MELGKVKKRNLYILVSVIIILALLGKNHTGIPLQTVAPECFEDEDCRVSVQKGYCEVKYGCVVGKCYSTQIRCPEICYGFGDEDMDTLIDCNDPDCFDSVYCPCINARYDLCLTDNCYCAMGSAEWVVIEGEGECICS